MVCAEPVQQCLLAGRVDPALIGSAPHIVRLDEGSALTARFRAEGWHRNWGIVCASPTKLLEVRRALRAFLQMRLPDGRPGLFRFYDPRVFVPHMDSRRPEERRVWFGPVTDFWAPFQGGTVHYTLDRTAVARQVLRGQTA
jgi:hypothetical protein